MTVAQVLNELIDEHVARAEKGDRLSRETAFLLALLRNGAGLDDELPPNISTSN